MIDQNGKPVRDGATLWLSCDQSAKFKGHTWTTQADRRERYGCVEPFCPRCGQMFVQFYALQVTVREDVQCTAKCWDAGKWICICSCGGRNHARGKPVDLDAETGSVA